MSQNDTVIVDPGAVDRSENTTATTGQMSTVNPASGPVGPSSQTDDLTGMKPSQQYGGPIPDSMPRAIPPSDDAGRPGATEFSPRPNNQFSPQAGGTDPSKQVGNNAPQRLVPRDEFTDRPTIFSTFTYPLADGDSSLSLGEVLTGKRAVTDPNTRQTTYEDVEPTDVQRFGAIEFRLRALDFIMQKYFAHDIDEIKRELDSLAVQQQSTR